VKHRLASIILVLATLVTLYVYSALLSSGCPLNELIVPTAFFVLLPAYAAFGLWKNYTSGIVAGAIYLLPQSITFTAQNYSYHAAGPISFWFTLGSVAEKNQIEFNLFAIVMLGFLAAIYDSAEDKCT
jgi:hypothetical protein